MLPIVQDTGIRGYKFAMPSEPAAYAEYFVLDALGSADWPRQEVCDQINSQMADPHVNEVHILILQASCSRAAGLQIWDEASRSTLEELGLSWFTTPPHAPPLFFHFLLGDDKVELPLVPEFAHDLARAKKLMEGDFYGVMPITAEFVTTLNCPFRCQQCSYKMQKISCGVWPLNDFTDPRWHMKVDIVKPLVRRLAEAGVQYLVVTGGGEPLMNRPATLAALEEGRKSGMKTGLYTNGALLSKRVAEQILDQSPSFVRVSVNAGSEQVHTQYHMPLGNRPLFHQVQDGVKQLALQKAAGQRSTEIGLSYIVNPVNCKDCGPFAQWVARTVEEVKDTAGAGGPAIDFVRFTPTIDYTHSQYSQDFFDEAVDLIRRDALPVLEEANVSVVLFAHRFNHIQEQKDYDECLGCSWFAEVSPDGSLHVCCEMNCYPGYQIGDLVRDSLASIWSSERREYVLSRLNKSGLRGCPSFCKPHTINKAATKIREKCKAPGEKARVWQWLQNLHELNGWQADAPFARQKTVAF